MKNPVVHFEIVGKDHEALQAYYRNLFEWELRTPAPEIPYAIVEAGEGEPGIGGGVGGSPTGTPHATFYVQVEDIEAALAKAVGSRGRGGRAGDDDTGDGDVRSLQRPGGQPGRLGLVPHARGRGGRVVLAGRGGPIMRMYHKSTTSAGDGRSTGRWQWGWKIITSRLYCSGLDCWLRRGIQDRIRYFFGVDSGRTVAECSVVGRIWSAAWSGRTWIH